MARIIDPRALNAPKKPPAPILRQELDLFPAEADADGAEAWILHDPLANRHFRLGQLEVDLLMLCGQGDAEKIAQLASMKMGLQVTVAQVTELFDFLRVNNLVMGDANQQAWYLKQHAASKTNVIGSIIKRYLFFRIPLTHPDQFLNNTIKYVSWLGNPLTFMLLGLLLLCGIFFTLRQLDTFLGTFLHFFTPEGFGIYLITLTMIKILHELGHAYTAKYMGCKVPIIGVAFLVGFPILYTDTSDAWKLKSRSQRIKIGIAGVAVELGVAIICLFCWSFLQDGMLRSVLFLLATTTWIMSIFVNFNPLMRFDGYYLISDALRIPNLEPRAFAMAKWWLREQLFALQADPPEKINFKLVYFAYAVWIYRLFLFLGIAVLVYTFFFKILGIVLFAIEIIYFILRPIMNEFKAWRQFSPQLHWNAITIRSLIFLCILLGIFFIPWRSAIEAPAFIKAHYTPVYAPVAGKIQQIPVKNNQAVNMDELLLEIETPELAYERAQAQHRYEELSWQRAYLGFNRKMRNETLVINSNLITQNQHLRGLIAKHNKRLLYAPNIGIVADLNLQFKTGAWIAEGTQIMAILDPNNITVHAYVAEDDLARIKRGNLAKFYPEFGHYPTLTAKLIEIDSMAVRSMDALYSASLFGGDVAVRETEDNELIPVISVYKVRLKLLQTVPDLQRVMRGTVILHGEPASIFQRLKNIVYAAFRRESNF